MKEGRIPHIKVKGRGQAIVEFVIALPILLFIIFGIIEFARMVFAWMAVQNAARFGIRYAVTGEFNELYCIEAGNLLGGAHVSADTDGGDPQDCLIPDSYIGADKADKERELIDIARLFSIQDAAVGGGTGLWLRPNVSGNYEQFLDLHNEAFIGLPDKTGFYHVTTCSNRNNQYIMDYGNFAIPLCKENITALLMDDAGGPGDRVKVHVEHRHPLFLPILSNLWPSIGLNSERDGIVEKFRTSRSLGVSGPILSAATWTQTPTVTDTPTITYTPTETYTSTPSVTPIPVDCSLIEIASSSVGLYGSGGYYGAVVTIRNNNPVPIHLFRADVAWEQIPPSRYLHLMRFNSSDDAILDDFSPPSDWVPAVPIELGAGLVGDYVALFKPVAVPVQGNTVVNLEFEDSCVLGITANLPTVTPSYTPTATDTPTITPTPDCDLYSMTGFTFLPSAVQNMTITNGDVVDALVNQIQFYWDYAENYGAANGYPNLSVDSFRWNGIYFHLGGNNDFVKDFDSPTNWIGGTRPFNNGSSYTLSIDFDDDWAFGGFLPGVVSNDFGIIIDFNNGCQLRRNAVPRTIITWTPTDTPTTTWTPSPPPPPTNTLIPSNTPLPTATPLPSFTFTPSFTPTNTPVPTNTVAATSTSLPTNTPVPSDTPIPSVTPIPPTSTPVTPSITPSPAPTDTPTPTWECVDDC